MVFFVRLCRYSTAFVIEVIQFKHSQSCHSALNLFFSKYNGAIHKSRYIVYVVGNQYRKMRCLYFST